MKATSLEDAIDNFNELQPLVFIVEEGREADPAASAEFYVERPDNPLDELKAHLLGSRRDEKILLTGHMGSGKSTELNRLAADQDIQKRFFVVKYGVRDVLNIIDIEYLDFLLSFSAVLFTRAVEGKIKFQPGTINRISGWIAFAKAEEGALQSLDAGKSMLDKVYNFFKSILSILAREVTLRQAVRQSIQRNISELVEVSNLTINQVRASLPSGRELLVIIDDLEKIPDVERAERLFNQAGGYMIMPHCKIIYTLPIALYYSVSFQQIVNTFSKPYFLRNIRVLERHSGQGVREAFDLLNVLLGKRIDLMLIDEEAQMEAFRMSGGVVRQLVRIMKDGTIKALARKRATIARDLISAAVIELRNEFSRELVARHYKVLDAVLTDQPIDDEKTLRELYHARILLEYENGERWNAVNPIVAPLLERYRRGLV
jgi:hypothetical protein